MNFHEHIKTTKVFFIKLSFKFDSRLIKNKNLNQKDFLAPSLIAFSALSLDTMALSLYRI